MSKRYMEKATREGRVALLPEYLQVGQEIWYWRESLCDDDGCPDMVTSCCPLNNGIQWYEDTARECSRQHPVLEHATIWSVSACFTPRGVEWVVNDLPAVADVHLRRAFLTTKDEALRQRPEEVLTGG